ncbi:hypothetical protein BDA99DRAFT_532580 [Phascolomyces articulosus]|uniref:Uncharacterized protein n=1 Tax=Phascolomyces articulosus TaxID=60185 RepID=A0AAD5PI46_9FUNG|nr:hypothetical protein BDA99DRAFT_532580 [Phascolomyces articulosus]
MTMSDQQTIDWRSDMQIYLSDIMNCQDSFKKIMITPTTVNTQRSQQAVLQNTNDSSLYNHENEDTFREQQFSDACHEIRQQQNQHKQKVNNNKDLFALIDQQHLENNWNSEDRGEGPSLLKWIKQKSYCWRVSKSTYDHFLELTKLCNEEIPWMKQSSQELDFTQSLYILESPVLPLSNTRILPQWSLQNRARILPITKVPRIDRTSLMKYQIAEISNKQRHISMNKEAFEQLIELYEGLHSPVKSIVGVSFENDSHGSTLFHKDSFRRLWSSKNSAEKHHKRDTRYSTSNIIVQSHCDSNDYHSVSSSPKNKNAEAPITVETALICDTPLSQNSTSSSTAKTKKGSNNSTEQETGSTMYVDVLPSVQRVIQQATTDRSIDRLLDEDRDNHDIKNEVFQIPFVSYSTTTPKPVSKPAAFTSTTSLREDRTSSLLVPKHSSTSPALNSMVPIKQKNSYRGQISGAQSSSFVPKSKNQADEQKQHPSTHYEEPFTTTIGYSRLFHPQHHNHSHQLEGDNSKGDDVAHVTTLNVKHQSQHIPFHTKTSSPSTISPTPLSITSLPTFKRNSEHLNNELLEPQPITTPHSINNKNKKHPINSYDDISGHHTTTIPLRKIHAIKSSISPNSWKFADTNKLTSSMFSPGTHISDFAATRRLYNQRTISQVNRPSISQRQQQQVERNRNNQPFCEINRLQDNMNEKHHFG